MNVLVLNGSPRLNGSVASLLRAVVEPLAGKHEVTWVDVCSLEMGFCRGCMVCRERGMCVLPEDGAHAVGELIRGADALVVGTPTHWGNMCAPLKLLFDRNVPVFMGENARGLPLARQKGKRAVIVTACTTPWPFSLLFRESRGAIGAVREVLHYGGYRIVGTLARPGSKGAGMPSDKLLRKARNMGMRLAE